MTLSQTEVRLEIFNDKWPGIYEKEKLNINVSLSSIRYHTIDHIGSTAIKGIIAKPIIDILIGVNSFKSARLIREKLENYNYKYLDKDTVPNRLFFIKENDNDYQFYLHVAEIDSDYYKDKLLFRNYLIANTKKAKEYSSLKKSLAAKFYNNRVLYTEAKTDFITKTLFEIKQNHI